MNIEALQKQSDQIEGFKAGYQAALQWMAQQLEVEKVAKEKADAAKKNNETVGA